MSKRLQAEEVLNDAKFALVRFHQCADDQERRVLWFSLIGQLRSVGHVLEKVDAPEDAELRRRVDGWWPEARKEPIFQDFIEKARNQFLKTYKPMPRRAVLVSTGGQVLMGSGGGPLTTVEPRIVEGTFAGRPAVEVAREAVAWWERELAPLTA